MDLSTLSKETLIHIIEDQQKKISDQQKLIDRLNKPKQINIELSEYEIYNEDTQEKELLDKETMFMYGTGPIRYKRDGKYYHGCGPMEYNWYKENKDTFIRMIFQYSTDKKLPCKVMDTYNASEFCMNCEDAKLTNKRLRNTKVYNAKGIIRYKCKGHPII